MYNEKEYAHAWYKYYSEQIKSYEKRQYIKNRLRKIRWTTKWNKEHPERRKEILRKSDRKHRKHKTEWQIQYRLRNPEKLKQYNITAAEYKRNWALRKKIFNTLKGVKIHGQAKKKIHRVERSVFKRGI